MERYAKYVGQIVMTFMVVFFVTGFVTWLNVGLSDDFLCVGCEAGYSDGQLLPSLLLI